MKLATLCSGIGAPEVAAKRLGWECLWSAEVDPRASAVLAHHHPESVNLGDITKIDGSELEKPDVLVFGTPCQSFSVAGRRAGMDDPRGVLAFVALGIVGRVRPTWFVLENVPGLLSSSQGRDFGAFLRAVDELGYSGAWASPDAQFFGLAQRRERVFFVGHIGDWRYPAAVLSQFSRLCGHPAPSREAGEEVAGTFTARTRSGGWGQDPNLAAGGYMRVVPPLTHNPYGDHESREEVTHTLDSANQAIAFMGGQGSRARSLAIGEQSPPLKSVPSGGNTTPSLLQGMSVRHLLPVECEKLQGFPPGYTAIPYKGKPMADGPRYKMIGNSMAVTVLIWLLARIGAMG